MCINRFLIKFPVVTLSKDTGTLKVCEGRSFVDSSGVDMSMTAGRHNNNTARPYLAGGGGKGEK